MSSANQLSVSDQIKVCDTKFNAQLQFAQTVPLCKRLFWRERDYMASINTFNNLMENYNQCIDNIKKTEPKHNEDDT
jgi:hypothetical protein